MKDQRTPAARQRGLAGAGAVSGARRFVRDRRRPTVNQHERIGQVSLRRVNQRHDRRKLGNRHAVAAGGTKVALVCRIGRSVGPLSCLACRVSCVVVAGVVVMGGCNGLSRLHLDLMAGCRAKQHGRSRKSLQGNRCHHQPSQKYSQTSRHGRILLRLPTALGRLKPIHTFCKANSNLPAISASGRRRFSVAR